MGARQQQRKRRAAAAAAATAAAAAGKGASGADTALELPDVSLADQREPSFDYSAAQRDEADAMSAIYTVRPC